MARTARRPTPIPIPTFAPVLRLLEIFGDAVIVLDGDAEAGMDGAHDEVALDDEVDDGTEVFCIVVVKAGVALVVTAIVYPAAECKLPIPSMLDVLLCGCES